MLLVAFRIHAQIMLSPASQMKAWPFRPLSFHPSEITGVAIAV